MKIPQHKHQIQATWAEIPFARVSITALHDAGVRGKVEENRTPFPFSFYQSLRHRGDIRPQDRKLSEAKGPETRQDTAQNGTYRCQNRRNTEFQMAQINQGGKLKKAFGS